MLLGDFAYMLREILICLTPPQTRLTGMGRLVAHLTGLVLAVLEGLELVLR